jgi:hypothetical protein
MSKKEKLSAGDKEAEYNKKYNKKRKPILRVEASASDSVDDIKEMNEMKEKLIQHSGNAKQGVIDMYRFSLERGFFDSKGQK